MDDIETIKEMYRQYWKCMIDKNAAGLREMMSADYYPLMSMKERRYYHRTDEQLKQYRYVHSLNVVSYRCKQNAIC